MATLATVLVWIFAVIGMLCVAGMVWGMIIPDEKKEPVKVEPQAQPQIVNIRPVAPTAPKPADQPQVLQKTQVQITTVRYADSNDIKKELSA